MVNICGVEIDFPFQPYPCQLSYMEKVVTCLQKGLNGTLESPTGTGKTLCLLCATLGWRETYAAGMQLERVGAVKNTEFVGNLTSKLSTLAGEKNEGGSWERGFTDVPKVIYASRTHTQISQCINELKNTRYEPKICVLGSREQMCLNSEVMKEDNNNGKVHMCRSKVSRKQCHYYNNLESSKADVPQGIMDIEDLVKIGAEKRFCPYYMARELRKEADVIFMPYNYVLDFKARAAHGVDLTNTIILIDEAHNLESHCESNSSFDLSSFDLASCVEDSQKCIEILLQREEEGLNNLDEASFGDLSTEDASLMKTLFLSLESFVCDIELGKDGTVTKPACFLFDEMAKFNVNQNSKDQILETLEKMSGVLASTKSSVFGGRNYALDKFGDALKTMFLRGGERSQGNDTSKYYKVHISLEKDKKGKGKSMDVWAKSSKTTNQNTSRTLSYWCFNPGLTMRELSNQGVRSIILTSGTLSPLPSFKAELLIPFDVELENGHVIEESQVFVGIVPQGPDGEKLNSSYQFRSTVEYQVSLGNTVVNLSRIIPSGLLVFFPSYLVMDLVLTKWKECGIWDRIATNKGLYIETRGKTGFTEVIEQFYAKINDPDMKGATFFAVCRGKVSEGLDFADANGRGVVITGLPFPPSFDPKVVLKQQYLDDQKDKNTISGREWYRQQASRAVNQAIGRVIRHKNDYGAIILADERFCQAAAKQHLPSWIKRQLKQYKDFGQVQRDISLFFRNIKEKMGHVEVKSKTKRKVTVNDDCSQTKKIKLTSRSDFFKQPSHPVCSTTVMPVQSLAQIDATAKRTSVFDSLNSPKSELPEPSLAQTPLSLAIMKQNNPAGGAKTKKYKLVKKDIPKPASTINDSTTCNRASSNNKEEARNYLLKVKKILPQEKYARFGSAMAAYKKNKEIQSLIEEFKEIFENDNENHMNVIKGFSFFLGSDRHTHELMSTYRKWIEK